MKPCPSEHMEQVQLVAWMRRTHPEHWIFAIPNGGGRSRAQGGLLKAEGVTPGVPDLFIPSLRLFVEMKRQHGGSVSPEQRAWGEYLQAHGYHWHVCRGFEEAQQAIQEALHG